MNLLQFITETENKTIAVLQGRMTPITKGHEENVNGLHKIAKENKADHLVIATHSHDTKTKGSANKNPLSPAQKAKHLKRAFPHTNVAMTSSERPSIFHQLSDLHKKGYEHLILASGADRTEDYERIKQYNGKEGRHGFYNFKSIKIQSTGERKEGVSGTDMRKHAEAGNYEKFKSGLASNLASNDKHAKAIYNDVRKGMNLNEIYDPHLKISKYQWGEKEGVDHMKKMTPGESKKFNKLKEALLPMLLRNTKSIKEEQLEFDGIHTKNFDQCPSAYKVFKNNIETIESGDVLGLPPMPEPRPHVKRLKFKHYLDI